MLGPLCLLLPIHSSPSTPLKAQYRRLCACLTLSFCPWLSLQRDESKSGCWFPWLPLWELAAFLTEGHFSEAGQLPMTLHFDSTSCSLVLNLYAWGTQHPVSHHRRSLHYPCRFPHIHDFINKSKHFFIHLQSHFLSLGCPFTR